jgi:hypothetical protein
MKEEMMSLYDYLGKAAGPELGKQIAEYAKIRKSKFATRLVDNKSYKGPILMYPKSFIAEFFAVKASLERKVSEPQENTLPF